MGGKKEPQAQQLKMFRNKKREGFGAGGVTLVQKREGGSGKPDGE